MRLYRMLEAIDSCPAPVVCACTATRSAAARGSSRARTSRSRGRTPCSASPRCGSGSSRRSSRRSSSRRSARAARRYFVTGERFDAGRRAPDRARVGGRRRTRASAAEAIVDAILAGGPEAVREAKRLVRERPTGVETARIAAARRTSDEGQDGLRAFLERRLAGLARRRGLAGAPVVRGANHGFAQVQDDGAAPTARRARWYTASTSVPSRIRIDVGRRSTPRSVVTIARSATDCRGRRQRAPPRESAATLWRSSALERDARAGRGLTITD